MEKISIIVPVYNVEQYLENCINSILNQTFKNYELILVNDGSTDNSGNICDRYKQKDSRIKVIHKKNEGLSSARNTGLDIACGKYIGFVDSDDSIHPRMYEILYELIKKYKADISCCNYKNIYNLVVKSHKELELTEIVEMNNIEAINNLSNKDMGIKLVLAWNKLYKKNIFDNLRYGVGRIHEDSFIAHKILYKCKKIVYTNNKLYYYLQRQNSITSTFSYKKNVDYILAQSERMKFCKKIGLSDVVYSIAKVYEYNLFYLYKEISNNKRDNEYLLKILRRNFIYNINILFRIKDIDIKSKISWIIFAINPKIYKWLFWKV